MLIKAQKEITRISDDEELNTRNYMESLSYVSTLYVFINELKTAIETSSIVFLPSFYGRNTSVGMNLDHLDKESEMKVLKLSSPLFFVDTTAKKVMDKMAQYCEKITLENGVITFILK